MFASAATATYFGNRPPKVTLEMRRPTTRHAEFCVTSSPVFRGKLDWSTVEARMRSGCRPAPPASARRLYLWRCRHPGPVFRGKLGRRLLEGKACDGLDLAGTPPDADRPTGSMRRGGRSSSPRPARRRIGPSSRATHPGLSRSAHPVWPTRERLPRRPSVGGRACPGMRRFARATPTRATRCARGRHGARWRRVAQRHSGTGRAAEVAGPRVATTRRRHTTSLVSGSARRAVGLEGPVRSGLGVGVDM